MKILLIEDEGELQQSIVTYLHEAAYLTESASTYFQAEDKIISFSYDLFIVDITLPDGNGLKLVELIKKQHSEAGIIIISAKNSLDDKLNGLNLGADDYLTKPFHLAELNARVNALIRRKKFVGNPSFSFEEIEARTASKELFVHGKRLDLTSKEYELLLYFMMNSNHLLSKQAIAEHLWGDYMEMADNFDFIYTHIRNLRKKIKDAGGNDYLETVYGTGYKFKN